MTRKPYNARKTRTGKMIWVGVQSCVVEAVRACGAISGDAMIRSEHQLRRVCRAVIAAATRVSNGPAKRSSERAFEILGKLEVEREYERHGMTRGFLGPGTVDRRSLRREQLADESWVE